MPALRDDRGDTSDDNMTNVLINTLFGSVMFDIDRIWSDKVRQVLFVSIYIRLTVSF